MKKTAIFLLVGIIVFGAAGMYIFVRDNNSNENEDTTQIADAQPYSQSDESDDQSQSEPISVPTEATVEDPDIAEPEVKMVTFMDPYLPGFSMEYLQDWILEERPFRGSAEFDYIPRYSSYCGEFCMEVQFTKAGIDVELIFATIGDDHGGVCSNTNEYTKIDENWYRISYDSEYVYTTTLVESVFVDQDTARRGGVSDYDQGYLQGGITYNYCDYLTGALLIERPPRDLWSEYATVYEESLILLEKPRVIGEPSEDLLTEIDQMIMSIQGLRDPPAGIYE